MGKHEGPDPAWHRDQIEKYTAIKPAYDLYADALRQVLEKAKELSVPEAFVQARPKAIASFAEKCVRKYEKYAPNPVAKMTDLCGARMIVHTLDQVEAVRSFIKCNFEIEEEDEKGLMLGKDKFGYRDLHFLIRLKEERAAAIGFTKEEIEAIGDKIAELQIRTVVQHAWADILHDRMYKTKLIYPPEFQRQGALLAAIMEDGDRQFNGLANDIDDMLTNFNVYATRDEVEKEIGIQEVIHENADAGKKPKVALALAKLHAAQGLYDEVCRVLSPHAQVSGPLRFEILLELGFALCKTSASSPPSTEYQMGQQYLKDVIKECRREALDHIPNVCKRKSMLARALTRLAWSYQSVQGGAAKARNCYREALREEPGNPYYLSEMLAYEIECTRSREMVRSMESTVLTAIATCHQLASNGTELPYACFTAGRLLLLLNRPDKALVDYAHGIRHLTAGNICVPPEVLEQEVSWLYRVIGPHEPEGGSKWILDLVALYQRTCNGCSKGKGNVELAAPVMIVAGSAGKGLSEDKAERLTEILTDAVSGMTGSIISGGTNVGVPKCISDAVSSAAENGHAVPSLLGYLPRSLPTGVKEDSRCKIVTCGEHDFSPAQLLCYWNDIFASGIDPNDVVLFGYGGGEISATEYAIALMLGAEVYLVSGSGRAADEFLKLEAEVPNMKGLPDDNASIKALFWAVSKPQVGVSPEGLETMAEAFHMNYVSENQNKMPANMRPWDQLDETYRRANKEQARYASGILKKCGFKVVPISDPGKALSAEDLSPKVDAMSELEHGRWNVDRLADGWRAGERDDKQKTHNCLVPWTNLPDDIREWDRLAIRKYPDILAGIGMKIVGKAEGK